MLTTQLSNLTVQQKKIQIKDTILKPRLGSTTTTTNKPKGKRGPKTKPKRDPNAPEFLQLRQYAKLLNKQNKGKLTTCVKCDKLGYAYYRLRSQTYKLVLVYVHSNEPPVKISTTRSHGRLYAQKNWRECWIGNIVTENELLQKVRAQQATEPQSQPQLQPQPETKPKPVVHKGGRIAGYRNRPTVLTPAIFLRVDPELWARINQLRGDLPVATFVRYYLEDKILGKKRPPQQQQ